MFFKKFALTNERMNDLMSQMDIKDLLSFDRTPTRSLEDLLTFIDVYFWDYNELPTTSVIERETAWDKVSLYGNQNKINNALESRGLPHLNITPVGGSKPRFDPMFVVACDLICNTSDTRSTAAKLKSAGLSTAQWKAFLNDKKSFDYFRRRVNKETESTKATAQISISKLVESGDLQAIKYFNEVQNVYRPQDEFLLNMGVIIAKLMEIIVSVVQDQDKIAAISDRFDQVLEIGPAE